MVGRLHDGGQERAQSGSEVIIVPTQGAIASAHTEFIMCCYVTVLQSAEKCCVLLRVKVRGDCRISRVVHCARGDDKHPINFSTMVHLVEVNLLLHSK